MAAYNANDTGILLESGTNELELLELTYAEIPTA